MSDEECLRPIRNKLEPSVRMLTSSSKVVPARLLRFQPLRLANMDMQNVILLQLISSPARNLTILFLRPTIVMSLTSIVPIIS